MATANQIPLHLPRRLDDVQRQTAGPHRNPLNLLMADFAPRDNEERALLCLIAPHVIKLHSSAQPGEGGGSVTLQSSIVKTGQSDGACCCRLSLVT